MCLAFALAFGLAGVGTVFAPVFWGQEFNKSGILIMGLSLTIPFMSFANVIRTQYLIPTEKDREYLSSVVCGAIINLVINRMLIPTMGSMGAMIGTIAAEILVCILFLACYLHDISMVKIPACDSFLLDTDKADELAKTLLDSYNEEFNKANLTKNVQGNDIDILSVKKYMLDSYRKIDNYFEEAVRSKHANDSAAEIRKRSELNYLDTSMRELVAEVSEAHGADERDIYGIKSVASKQLITIILHLSLN